MKKGWILLVVESKGVFVDVTKDGAIFNGKGKLLKTQVDKAGYCSVSCKGKRFLVHRLVAMAYLDEFSEDKHIHHIDGNKANNHVDNIMVMSMEEHQKLHKQIYPLTKVCEICGKTFTPNKTKRKRAKICSYDCWRKMCFKSASERKRPINQYSLEGDFIKKWDSGRDIQNETGYFDSNINKCCNGKINSYKGFIWRYASTSLSQSSVR